MSENESGFKVNDKRRFADDGTAKEGVKEEQTSKMDSSKSNEPREKVDRDYDSAALVNFSSFIMGLGTQTMIMLGEFPHPETGKSELNLEAARQTIDILAMLEEKTEGNLNDSEKKLLAEILASLRMAYVAKKKGV